MDDAAVDAAVREVLAKPGADETILEYLVGVLADEHFPWSEAFDHIGGFMVGARGSRGLRGRVVSEGAGRKGSGPHCLARQRLAGCAAA